MVNALQPRHDPRPTIKKYLQNMEFVCIHFHLYSIGTIEMVAVLLIRLEHGDFNLNNRKLPP